MSIPSSIICYILAAVIITVGATITYGGITFAKFVATYTAPPPTWSIVCNDSGRYSYIGFDGDVASKDYATKVEAEEQMDRERLWHLKYNEDRASGKLRQERQAEAQRKAAFKPCPPAKSQ